MRDVNLFTKWKKIWKNSINNYSWCVESLEYYIAHNAFQELSTRVFFFKFAHSEMIVSLPGVQSMPWTSHVLYEKYVLMISYTFEYPSCKYWIGLCSLRVCTIPKSIFGAIPIISRYSEVTCKTESIRPFWRILNYINPKSIGTEFSNRIHLNPSILEKFKPNLYD